MPWLYHATNPENADKIQQEGFNTPFIDDGYIDNDFDAFYADLSPEDQLEVDDTLYDENGDKIFYGPQWEKTRDTLSRLWHAQHGGKARIWGATAPDLGYGDAVLRFQSDNLDYHHGDDDGGEAFLNHDGDIPASAFHRVPQEELDKHKDDNGYWWDRAPSQSSEQ